MASADHAHNFLTSGCPMVSLISDLDHPLATFHSLLAHPHQRIYLGEMKFRLHSTNSQSHLLLVSMPLLFLSSLPTHPLHDKDQAFKSCMIHGLSKHMFCHCNRLCKSSCPSYIQCSTSFTHCAYPHHDGHIPPCVLCHILVKQWTSGTMKPIYESCSERITPSTRTANI